MGAFVITYSDGFRQQSVAGCPGSDRRTVTNETPHEACGIDT